MIFRKSKKLAREKKKDVSTIGSKPNENYRE